MKSTETTLLISYEVDIRSESDLETLRTMRPKTKMAETKFSFICNDCKQVRRLLLKSITAFPILCRSCRLRHRYDDPEYFERIKRTNLERYGVEFNSQTREWKESFKKTCLKKYGYEHYSKSQTVKDKIRSTTLQRFDGIGFASTELRGKQRKTMLERYNAYHNLLSPVLKEQFFKVIVGKYGGIGNAVPSIREKQMETNFQLYGISSSGEIAQLRENYKRKYQYNNIWFDSLPEIKYYIDLLNAHTPFVYHPNQRYTYIVDGIKHYYHPDFMVNDVYVEIKGAHFFGNQYADAINIDDPNLKMINPYNRKYDYLAQAKFECMKQNNVHIIVVNPISNPVAFIKQNNIIVHIHKHMHKEK